MSNVFEQPTVLFKEPQDWTQWIEAHQGATGIWIKFAKKGKNIESINYDQALEEALCYGWIDGQLKGMDDTYYLQRFTPRRPKSTWSTRNCQLAEQLIAAGKMQPAGQKEVDAAKADGRWQAAYASPANATIPQDFLNALAKNKKAQAFYETLNRRNTYPIYVRLHNVKKPETRVARIEKIITMFAEGKKFYP